MKGMEIFYTDDFEIQQMNAASLLPTYSESSPSFLTG